MRYGLNVRDIAQASSLGRTYPAEMRERAVRMVREGEAAFGSEGDLVWAEPESTNLLVGDVRTIERDDLLEKIERGDEFRLVMVRVEKRGVRPRGPYR